MPVFHAPLREWFKMQLVIVSMSQKTGSKNPYLLLKSTQVSELRYLGIAHLFSKSEESRKCQEPRIMVDESNRAE